MKIRNYHNNKFSVQSDQNIHVVIENHSEKQIGCFSTLNDALIFMAKYVGEGFEGQTPSFMWNSTKHLYDEVA